MGAAKQRGGGGRRRRFRRHHRRGAVVIGRWADDKALLKVDDGSTVEVTVPEPLRAVIDVGAEVQLGDDNAVDWRAAGNAP